MRPVRIVDRNSLTPEADVKYDVVGVDERFDELLLIRKDHDADSEFMLRRIGRLSPID